MIARLFHTLVTFTVCLVLLTGSPALADPIPEARIVINTASRVLSLYSGDTLVREYPVGVGQPKFQTPLGEYKVINKVIEPIFENPFLPNGKRRVQPGWRNPLGTRWIGFKEYAGGEYGIHGTYQGDSVGQFSSHGCVRMHVADSEELFDLVDEGTPVEVIYDLVAVQADNGNVSVTVMPDTLKKGFSLSLGKAHQSILKKYPNAKIDAASLTKALEKPSPKPVVVGTLDMTTAAKVDPDGHLFKLRISN